MGRDRPEAGKFGVKLNMQDNDPAKDKILKRSKSTAGRRSFKLSAALLQELRLWKLRCPPNGRDLVVVNAIGKPLSRKQVSNILDETIEKAQAKRLTPRGLRHTFCSLLIADGIPVTKIAKLVGHKDPSVTLKVYAHFVPQETTTMEDFGASILHAQ
jgi:integrase